MSGWTMLACGSGRACLYRTAADSSLEGVFSPTPFHLDSQTATRSIRCVRMTYPRPALGLVWAQYGPYHSARAAALAKLASSCTVHAIEIASRTKDYQWDKSVAKVGLISLCPGRDTEEVPFLWVFLSAHRQLSRIEA